MFEDYSKIQKKEFSMRKNKKIKVGDRVEVHHTPMNLSLIHI